MFFNKIKYFAISNAILNKSLWKCIFTCKQLNEGVVIVAFKASECRKLRRCRCVRDSVRCWKFEQDFFRVLRLQIFPSFIQLVMNMKNGINAALLDFF